MIAWYGNGNFADQHDDSRGQTKLHPMYVPGIGFCVIFWSVFEFRINGDFGRFGPWNLWWLFSIFQLWDLLAAKARNMIVNHLQQRYLGIPVQISSGESWVTLREGLIWDRLVEGGTSTSRFSMLVNYILYYICIMICPGWRQFRSRECTIVRPDSYLFQVILSFDEICAISQPVPSGKHGYILFKQVCFSESERVGNLTTDVHLLKIHEAFLELELLIFCHVLTGLPPRWVLRFFCLSGLKKHKLDTSGISCNKSYPAEPVHLKCLCLQSLENSGVHEINQPWLSSLALYQISRFRRRIHGKAWKTTHHEW